METNDYRPKSILCQTSKILETVASKQMTAYIYKKYLLDPLLSGFWMGHSTHTTLNKIVDDIRVAVDDRKIVLLIAIDLTQAFDLVNISLLIDKFKELGLSDSVCQWALSFLKD